MSKNLAKHEIREPTKKEQNEQFSLKRPRGIALPMNIQQLGQVFTPPDMVERMIGMRRNKGTVLEPCAGGGAFMAALGADAVGIELDGGVVTDKRIHVGDFFAYPTDNRFDTIIGNPPYVRFQDIRDSTKRLLPMCWFDRRSNLYLFFIAKCMSHLKEGGELIFITPRDFLKSTNAKMLNGELYRQGAITDFYDLGDVRIFNGFTPNCAIWRWECGRRSKKTAMGNLFCHQNGQIWFGDKATGGSLGDFFRVKVGAVSGADSIFSNQKHGNISMVCSRTRKDGLVRKMIYNKKCRYLEQFKPVLIKRRIRRFDESNWWEWGRGYHKQEGERIYVNCKTRNPKPFFVSEIEAYDGSVMALFPNKGVDAGKAVDRLNKVDWQALGFICDGRLLFTQKSLQNAPIGGVFA